MKKVLVALLVLVTLAVGLIGCDSPNTEKETQKPVEIELTVENCDYYLSFNKQFISSTRTAIGNYLSYSCTVNGALSGAVYSNCVLYYKFNSEDSEHKVSLNVSGYAQFNMGGKDSMNFTITRASGKIIL